MGGDDRAPMGGVGAAVFGVGSESEEYEVRLRRRRTTSDIAPCGTCEDASMTVATAGTGIPVSATEPIGPKMTPIAPAGTAATTWKTPYGGPQRNIEKPP
jgi:hypothetical protein